MEKRPFVGVSGSIEPEGHKQYIPRVYLRSLLKAGVIPVLLSIDMDVKQLKLCLSRLDGVMLSGGNDLDPALFGEEAVPEVNQISPLRDEFEIRLIKEAYRDDMPIFAICRGIQTLNVALGGTLYQDLPTQYPAPEGAQPIAHLQSISSKEPSHRVNFPAGSPLRAIFAKESIKVNSLHHQAIKAVAKPLVVCAYAEDQVIEAVYDPGKPFIWGVQWHPERLAAGAPLFSAFARAASDYSERKEVGI